MFSRFATCRTVVFFVGGAHKACEKEGTTMKKICNVLLSVLLVLTLGIVGMLSASAEPATDGQVNLSASTKNAKVGDIITVTVTVKPDSKMGLSALDFKIDYDASALELVNDSYVSYGLIGGFESLSVNAGRLGYAGATLGSANAGTVVTAKFKVLQVNTKIRLTELVFGNKDNINIAEGVAKNSVTSVTIGCAHRFGAWEVTKPATCKVQGEKQRTCKDCGATETAKTELASHTAGEWKVVSEPTCTAAGRRVRYCTVCGAEAASEAIPALGHNIGNWKVTKEPSCEQNGGKTAYCSRCSKTVTEQIPALGHKFAENAWKVTKEPDCEHTGTKTNTCTACGKTVTEQIPARGHKFVENAWKVTKEPDCEHTGTKTNTCTVCQKTVTEEIPARGHRFADGQWSVTKEPDCVHSGEKTGVCADCGKTVTEEIPARGHDFGEWTVIQEPTETEKGMKQRVCKVCTETEFEEIEMLSATLPVEETAEETSELQEIENEKSNNAVIIIVVALVVLLISAGIAVAVFVRKKQKRENSQGSF